MLHPGALLEENLDRVIASVVRNVSAGRGAVPGPDEPATDPLQDAAIDAGETMADLCGHVAYALKALDSPQRALGTYRGPDAPITPPTLNLVR